MTHFELYTLLARYRAATRRLLDLAGAMGEAMDRMTDDQITRLGRLATARSTTLRRLDSSHLHFDDDPFPISTHTR